MTIKEIERRQIKMMTIDSQPRVKLEAPNWGSFEDQWTLQVKEKKRFKKISSSKFVEIVEKILKQQKLKN